MCQYGKESCRGTGPGKAGESDSRLYRLEHLVTPVQAVVLVLKAQLLSLVSVCG